MGEKNRIIKVFILCCVMAILIVIVAIRMDGRRGVPELRIALRQYNPASREILVQLTVTNSGKHRLLIPGLRKENFDRCKIWNGWVVVILQRGRGSFAYSSVLQKDCDDFSRQSLIVLEPGEHFEVTLNIADTHWISPYDEDYGKPPVLLRETPGEYEILFRLVLLEWYMPVYSRWGVWRGEVESNQIHFSIPPTQS